MSVRLLQHILRLRRMNLQQCVINYNLETHKNYAINYAAYRVQVPQKQRQQQQSCLHDSSQTASQRQQRQRQDNPKVLNVEQLINKLNAHYEYHGYVTYELVNNLLDKLEQNATSFNQLLDEKLIRFLLNACADLMPTQTAKSRWYLFQRFWHYLSQHGQLKIEHYFDKLHVQQHNRLSPGEIKELLTELTALNITPTPQLYSHILAVACSNGELSKVDEVLKIMQQENIKLTERDFNALMLANVYANEPNACDKVLQNMSDASVSVSNATHATLIQCAILQQRFDDAMKLLDQYSGQFQATQALLMLRTALLHAVVPIPQNMLQSLLHQLPESYTTGTEMQVNLRNLCIELLHMSKFDAITNLIKMLPAPVFAENQSIDTYGVFLLHALFNANMSLNKINEICQLLLETGKNTRALHIATEMGIRRSPPFGLQYLEVLSALEPLRVHYFWPLLMYNHRRHGESGIFRTLQHMSNFQVNCDEETINSYILPLLSVTLEDCELALKKFNDVGVKTSLVLTPILSLLLLQLNYDKVQKLVELYESKINTNKLVQPLVQLAVNARATKRNKQFSQIVAKLYEKRVDSQADFLGDLLVNMFTMHAKLLEDLSFVKRLINDLHNHNLCISASALETLKSCFQSCSDKSSVEQILKTMQLMVRKHLLPRQPQRFDGTALEITKHPREMTLSELECHLVELQSKGMNTRGVLRRLLQLCVRDGHLRRALEVKKECDELQVQVSAGMLASILDLHVKLQDLPQAQQSLQRLQQMFPAFRIDEHKLIDYAALLVHETQLDAAKELLQTNANQQKINGGDYVLKNVWHFLTNVAHLAAKLSTDQQLPKERNLTWETFNFLRKLRYCGPHNAVLGPIVRERLLRADISSAVDEFCQLTEQFKHTPLQFELLSLLIKLCNNDEDAAAIYHITADVAQHLLETVTQFVKNVHGNNNLNCTLLLAFAASGTESQLRRLIINPEFSINQELFWKNCEHLGKSAAVPTLLRLARGVRNLRHIVDEQQIYQMLLQQFVMSNDFEAAVDLYERLEADDELKISQEFLRQLVNLLKVNNVDVPSNIALRAQVL